MTYSTALSSPSVIAFHLCSFVSLNRPIVSNTLSKLYRKSTEEGTEIKALMIIYGKQC